MLKLSYLGIVHPAGLFLAIAADEGDGVAVAEHLNAILDLPGLQTHNPGYMLDIQVFH